MIIEVKVCENCNHRNAVTAVECEECGYDLTFAFPQKIDDSVAPKTEEMIACDNDSCSESIPCNGVWTLSPVSNESLSVAIEMEMSIGRDCDCFNEQLNSSNYTSRIHAKLRIVDGKLEVMDASTNGTFIDEVRIAKMEWVVVPDGAIVKFADVSFRVRRT